MDVDDKTTSLTLLGRVRNRDDEAWRRLVFLYAPLVLRWCSYWGVRDQDADDVQQEVFQAISTNLDDFRRDRPGDTFRGWLRAITRNKLLDLFRRRNDQPQAQGGTDALRHLVNAASPEFPEDNADDLGALNRRALELVRSEFEDRTWQAFWRATVEEQAPADIAADLGMTAVGVRKAKSRVLHRLRQEIGELID
jgi:RNA polymerase sigma-70 factor (ECF subfamily)